MRPEFLPSNARTLIPDIDLELSYFSYQFLPGSVRFTLDDRASGYRMLRLFEDGHIETRVGRVDT